MQMNTKLFWLTTFILPSPSVMMGVVSSRMTGGVSSLIGEKMM